MSLLIQSVVSIDPVQSRAFTTERADSGFSTQTMTVSGYTDRTATLAAAKEAARQLNEMAANVNYRIVHIADSEDNQYDGLYELRGATVTATPATSNSRAALFAVSVTLRRVGGERVSGTNLSRTLRHLATLMPNSWSITGTPIVTIPVGATVTSVIGAGTVSTANGSAWYANTSAALPYTLAGADVNTGECKVWDGLGSTARADWARVWSPDHRFADPRYLRLDNGLITIGPVQSTNTGSLQYHAWDGTQWQGTGPPQEIVPKMGAAAFGAILSCEILALSPHRVQARWVWAGTTAPFYWPRISVTLERGSPFAYFELDDVTGGSGTIEIALTSAGNYVVARKTSTNRDDAADTLVDAPTISLADDNWIAMVPAAGITYAGMMAAVNTTNTAFSETGGNPPTLYRTATTSFQCYIGMRQHNATTYPAREEAEAGTRSGTAALTSDAGASGGGNNCVTLPALNDGVESITTKPQPLPTIIRCWARIKNTGVSASDSATVYIRNGTSGTLLANSAFTFAALGSTATWKWVSCEWNSASWNGTDLIHALVTRSAAGGGGTLLVDQYIVLSISNAALTYPKSRANAALTQMYIWDEISTAVH